MSLNSENTEIDNVIKNVASESNVASISVFHSLALPWHAVNNVQHFVRSHSFPSSFSYIIQPLKRNLISSPLATRISPLLSTSYRYVIFQCIP